MTGRTTVAAHFRSLWLHFPTSGSCVIMNNGRSAQFSSPMRLLRYVARQCKIALIRPRTWPQAWLCGPRRRRHHHMDHNQAARRPVGQLQELQAQYLLGLLRIFKVRTQSSRRMMFGGTQPRYRLWSTLTFSGMPEHLPKNGDLSRSLGRRG